jgi:hypothetical protein
MEMRNWYRTIVENPKGKKPLGRYRSGLNVVILTWI